jgi:AraC-like DNA-binding protein
MLAARLPRLRGIDPLVGHALARFGAEAQVGEVVRECGCSHRYFTARFRHDVGLKPKTFCRLQRFSRVLETLAEEPAVGWAELAAAEGYADQPHLTRDFREFAGLSPGSYRRRAPVEPRHVPV